MDGDGDVGRGRGWMTLYKRAIDAGRRHVESVC